MVWFTGKNGQFRCYHRAERIRRVTLIRENLGSQYSCPWAVDFSAIASTLFLRAVVTRMVKKLERIEMAQLAVSSILFKSLSLKLP
jgi:hypothetical protein